MPFDLDNETWKDIKGFEGMYQISNKARVKSLSRKYKGVNKFVQEHIISQFDDNYGYLQFSLFKDNKKYTLKTHRVLAETFILNPENKPCVNHINGNKRDNRLENLEWCTYQYNTRHAWKIGLCSTKKYKHYTTKVVQLDNENNILAVYTSQRIASKINNVSYKALNMCLKGKSKTCGGYKWRYKKKDEVFE